jgi:hypothetical protein
MRFYPHFILPMRSSRGFASTARDYMSPLQTRFRFGSTAVRFNPKPRTVSRRIIMQKARRHPGAPLTLTLSPRGERAGVRGA